MNRNTGTMEAANSAACAAMSVSGPGLSQYSGANSAITGKKWSPRKLVKPRMLLAGGSKRLRCQTT
jgi:hypothetical protein